MRAGIINFMRACALLGADTIRLHKRMWTPVIGKELTVLPEENNIHDRHAKMIDYGGGVGTI